MDGGDYISKIINISNFFLEKCLFFCPYIDVLDPVDFYCMDKLL